MSSDERPLVSVLVPTRNRPDLLAQCLMSISQQGRGDVEVLVGDDSEDDKAEAVLQETLGNSGLAFRRLNNRPPLGQAANVNALFTAASGTYLLLIHDDDLLLSDAISRLTSAMDDSPEAVAAYGRQRLIDNQGNDLGDEAADNLNATFFRTAEDAGVQPNGMISAIRRQFPNNGWLVRRDAALKASYLPENDKAGDAVDAAFGVELARQNPGPFVLIADYTAAYRITEQSIARSNPSAAADFYEVLSDLDVEGEVEQVRRQELRRGAPAAARAHSRHNRRGRALQIWSGNDYGLRRFSPRGLYCLAAAVLPAIDQLRFSGSQSS